MIQEADKDTPEVPTDARHADALTALLSVVEVLQEQGDKIPKVYVYPDEMAAMRRAIELLEAQ